MPHIVQTVDRWKLDVMSYSRGESVKNGKKKEIHLRERSFQTAQCALYGQIGGSKTVLA